MMINDASLVEIVSKRPVLGYTGLSCWFVSLCGSVGLGTTLLVKRAILCGILAIAGGCGLAGTGFSLIWIASIKLTPTLTSRWEKPVPKRVALIGCGVCFASCSLGVASVAVDCEELAVLNLVYGSMEVVLAVVGFVMIFGMYLIDLEVYKPSDSEYDSIILYYVRCLCCSDRRTRFVMCAIPMYVVTVIGVACTIYYWNSDDDEKKDCDTERRAYLSVSASLLGLYSIIVTTIIIMSPTTHARFSPLQTHRHHYHVRSRKVLCCSAKVFSRLVLLLMISTSLSWGFLGGGLIFTSDCASGPDIVWHIARGMHLLLVIFGGMLLALTLTCKTESLLMDYYAYYPNHVEFQENQLNQLIQSPPTSVAPMQYFDSFDTDIDDQEQGLQVSGSGQPSENVVEDCDIILSTDSFS